MVYKEIPPPAALADFVRHFWYIEHKAQTCSVIPFRLMADGFPSLIFQYKNQFKDRNDCSHAFPKTLLFGHTTTFRDLLIQGDFGVFGIALFPYTLQLLYNLPGKAFANHIIHAEALLPQQDKCLEERVALAPHHQARIHILTDYLITRLCQSTKGDRLVQQAVQRIIRSAGTLRIDAITKHIGVSLRQFERRFREQVGINSKTFSRIIRFQHTLNYPKYHSVTSLTELAFCQGYADQAHFIREFRAFSGINPKFYFKRQHESAENLIPL